MTSKENFTTTEICTPLSHGIWDHVYKFSAMPISFPIYCHMLCFAKKQGPDQGSYRFSIKELIRLFTFGNEPRGDRRQSAIGRHTIRRAIMHLQDIEFIEILHTPKDRKDNCWVVRVKKYKGGIDSFMTVLQVNKSDDGEVLDFAPMDEQQVLAFDKEHENDVAEDTEERESKEPDHVRHNYDRWLNLLSLNLIANIVKIVSSSKPKIHQWNRKIILELENDKNEAARMLAEDLKKRVYNLKSSHELLPPELAIKVTNHLNLIIKQADKSEKPKIKKAAVEARYEFVMQYWNHMRWNGEFALHRIKTPPDAKRMKQVENRFNDAFFRDNWAFAICRMRASSYCRGEITSWKASLHGNKGFLKSDEAVREAIDGERYVENGNKRSGGRSGLARSFEADDYKGKGSSIFDDEDPGDGEDSAG